VWVSLGLRPADAQARRGGGTYGDHKEGVDLSLNVKRTARCNVC
jgi:hypothetical protein